MFAANKELQVSDVDFENIKKSIKKYISRKTEFVDYDFEGSTINYLVDVLAYNTYLNSFHTNMAINESFLDTAQIRSNVVSNAKELGYTPKSAMASSATITLTFKPTNSPSQIVIPRGTNFQSVKDGINYNFVTIEDYVLTPDDGLYIKNIKVYEGERVIQTFTYSDQKEFYEILEKNIDLTSLIVSVKTNTQSTDVKYLIKVTDIINLDETSEIYYIQENSNEKFELYFGDNILGKKLENGNIINLDYITTTGDEANNLVEFKPIGYTGYNISDMNIKYTATVRTVEKSTNGKAKEGIESIRFNAPNFYSSQNRLVTAQDFENYVYAMYPFVESVNVWGGEENIPPVYGRIILSIKPFDGYAIQQMTKNSIVNDMKKKNIMGIEPIIIDPIFTFIKPSIIITYDSTRTVITAEEIFNKVQTQIQKFESESLSVFGKSFTYSTFIRIIDETDNSIIGNDVEIQLEKRLVPLYNSTISYKLYFGAAVKHPYDGYIGSLSSTGFKTNTTAETLYIEDNGFGKIRSFYYQSGNNEKKIYNENVGTIDYVSGEVDLKAFYFTGLENDEFEFKVYISPAERNYTQDKNQILLLSNPYIQIKNLKLQQIVKSGIVDVNGNYTPIPANSINTPFVI